MSCQVYHSSHKWINLDDWLSNSSSMAWDNHNPNVPKRKFPRGNPSRNDHTLGCPPSQDACGKRRFRLGSPILKMVHNPGGDDCILGGGTTQTIPPFLITTVVIPPELRVYSRWWAAWPVRGPGWPTTGFLRIRVQPLKPLVVRMGPLNITGWWLLITG